MTSLKKGDRVRIVDNNGQLKDRLYTVMSIREDLGRPALYARISERPGWGTVPVLTSHLRKVES